MLGCTHKCAEKINTVIRSVFRLCEYSRVMRLNVILYETVVIESQPDSVIK